MKEKSSHCNKNYQHVTHYFHSTSLFHTLIAPITVAQTGGARYRSGRCLAAEFTFVTFTGLQFLARSVNLNNSTDFTRSTCHEISSSSYIALEAHCGQGSGQQKPTDENSFNHYLFLIL